MGTTQLAWHRASAATAQTAPGRRTAGCSKAVQEVIPPIELRRKMVEALRAEGRLRSGAWLRAFERVPRHVLVPSNDVRHERDGSWTRVTADSDGGLQAVYDHRRTLRLAGDEHGYATVTATMPRIIADHLEELEVEDGHRVLEIGTGSGYSTALLCERLGSAHVTSVDIEEDAIRLAGDRLSILGHHPTLVAGDGYQGHPPNGPYDRLLAEVQVPRIPRPWLAQMRAGGRIVAVMPRNLARLTVHLDGTASGRFHVSGYSYLRLRGEHKPAWIPMDELSRMLWDNNESRPTHIDLGALLNDDSGGRALPGWHDWWDMFRLIHIPHEYAFWPDDEGVAVVDLAGRWWVRLYPEPQQVVQGGPRRLWDLAEEFRDLMARLGWPAKDRFGLTVHPDGSHVFWLDDPESPNRWAAAP